MTPDKQDREVSVIGKGPPSTFSALITSGYVQVALVVVAVVLGLYLCYRLTVPFLTPLALALVLSILVDPFNRCIEAKLEMPAAAATVTVVTIAIIVFVPLAFLVAELIQQATAAALAFRGELESGLVQKSLAAHPKVAPFVARITDQIDVQGMITQLASWLTNVSGSFLRGSITQFIGVLLTFYLLFYFLRDRREALASVRAISPFNEPETTAIFGSVVDTVHAIIYGTVITGVIQGLLGGIIFAIAALPAPLLWGMVMGLFGILPVLGTALIWIPAVLLLALNGKWITAVAVSAAFIGISVFDRVLYPVLVGRRMKLHTVLVFISAIGGLILFGPPGFVLGPLVFAVILAIKDILRSRAETHAAT